MSQVHLTNLYEHIHMVLLWQISDLNGVHGMLTLWVVKVSVNNDISLQTQIINDAYQTSRHGGVEMSWKQTIYKCPRAVLSDKQ